MNTKYVKRKMSSGRVFPMMYYFLYFSNWKADDDAKRSRPIRTKYYYVVVHVQSTIPIGPEIVRDLLCSFGLFRICAIGGSVIIFCVVSLNSARAFVALS